MVDPTGITVTGDGAGQLVVPGQTTFSTAAYTNMGCGWGWADYNCR
jgi:hypothetical protein